MLIAESIYSCVTLKYGSFIFVIFGVIALITSFCLKEEIKTNCVIFLHGLSWTICGLLMFNSMRIVSWELYMFSWIMFSSSILYISLIECPPPKSKMANTILAIDKAMCINVTGKGNSNNV